MFILETFVLGSLAYAGGRLVFRRKSASTENPTVLDPATRKEQGLQLTQAQIKRDLWASSTALGLAVTGTALRIPFFSLASLPIMLLVFAATYGEAWRALCRRRVDSHVLDATRISVCVVMGYTVIAALNALLHAASQRLFLNSEEELRNTLQDSLGLQERVAWVDCGGIEMQTPLEKIKPGLILALRGGDTVQASGLVLSGNATVCPRFAEDQVDEVKRGDWLDKDTLVLAGLIYLCVEVEPQTSSGLFGQLQDAPLAQTPLRLIGESVGRHMAPWMLTAFAFSTPLMGINRAAAFLATGFGAQMHRLSPYTARQFIGFASRYGILIRDPLALELANLVNTVIFDARVLDHPAARPHVAGLVYSLGLRSWPTADKLALPFATYVMAASEEQGRSLADEFGLDGYFIEAIGSRRAELVGELQLSGRIVCYVGTGDEDAEVMQTAVLSVDVHEPSDLRETKAHIVLQDPRMRGLCGAFDLARLFFVKERFNLLAPVGIDLIEISTTVFLHFGLTCSVLLSYLGLLSGIAQSKMPKSQPIALPKAPPAQNCGKEEQKLIT